MVKQYTNYRIISHLLHKICIPTNKLTINIIKSYRTTLLTRRGKCSISLFSKQQTAMVARATIAVYYLHNPVMNYLINTFLPLIMFIPFSGTDKRRP